MEKSEETRRKSPPNRDDENLESEMKILTLVENTPIAMEKTIKTVMERLPLDVFSDEILLKIMGNLSTFDILRKIAQVSKRFHRLSLDKCLIKQAEFKNIEFIFNWRYRSAERKEKYFNDFFEVLNNAQKLKSLSIHLDLPSMEKFCRNWNWNWNVWNYQCLEEFCIHVRFIIHSDSYMDYLKFGVCKIIDRCPNLKRLEIVSYLSCDTKFILILNTIANSFNSKCLQELHLTFYNFGSHFCSAHVHHRCLKNVIKKMTENLPNMQYFHLAWYIPWDTNIPSVYTEVCREMASESKIKIEIRNTRDNSKILFG